MEKIAQAGPDAIVSGQHPGLPNQSIPLWRRGSNVVFEDRAIKPAPTEQVLFVGLSAGRVTGLKALYQFSAGVTVPAALWGTRTSLFKGVTPPTTTNVSRLVGGPYTGLDSDLWSIVQFGQALLATNGKDEVQYLAPAGLNFVNISTVSDLLNTFRAKILMVNGPYVLAFNTNNDPSEFRWCDEDNPLVWVPAATNSARDIQIRDLLSDIVAVVDFAEGLMVCGRTQAHYVTFVGPPLFFAQDHMIEGAGAVSIHSVLAFDRIAYGFGPDGIWETDGSTIHYISVPSVHRHIYEDTLDKTRLSEVISWADPDNVLLFWGYPTKDGRGTTISYNRQLKLWSLHDYWRTAASEGGPWQFPLTASSAGNVYGQQGGAGAVVGNSAPVHMDTVMTFDTTYGHPGYGGLGYGGTFQIDGDTLVSGSDERSFEDLVMTKTSGGITVSLGTAQDTLQAWIRTKALDFENPAFVKFLEKIDAHITNRTTQTNLVLEIYGSDSEDGPFADILQTIPLGSNDPGVFDIPMRRYYELLFIDRGVKERWRLHGFEIFGELGGDEF